MPLVIAPPIELADEERTALEVMARSPSLSHRVVTQATALLYAADGVANEEIARRCSTTPDTVRRWRRRFAADGVEGVGVIAEGRGRRSWLPEGTVAESKRFSKSHVYVEVPAAKAFESILPFLS